MHTITDIGRALADLDDAVSEHRTATERREGAELLLEAARNDSTAAAETLDATRKELLALCGDLVLQQANPADRLERFVVYATHPQDGRDVVLDTGDQARARAEHQRLETQSPGSDPCVMHRVYVLLDSTVVPTAAARPAHRPQQDAETPTTDVRETA